MRTAYLKSRYGGAGAVMDDDIEFAILDLFCGAGGAAMGIRQAMADAGIANSRYKIVGVDNVKPSEYAGDQFMRLDITEWYKITGWQAVWASPPCQRFS